MSLMQLTRRSAHHAERVRELFQRSNSRSERDPLAAQVLDELAHVLEALQTTEEDLAQAYERQADGYALLQAEHQTYYDLFTNAPFAYLTTRLDGTIRRANLAAHHLLQLEAPLVGRSLSDFIAPDQRREFERLLPHAGRMPDAGRIETTVVRAADAASVTLTGYPVCNSSGRPHELRWVIQTTNPAHTAAQSDPSSNDDPHASTQIRFFAAALTALHQARTWTAAGLQLAHLAVSSVAHVWIIERTAGGQIEQILAVRNGADQDETHLLRQKAHGGAARPAPAGELSIANAAAIRQLGLPEAVATLCTPHLPLRGYAASCTSAAKPAFRIICLHAADQAADSAAQRAMLHLLLEEICRLDTGE